MNHGAQDGSHTDELYKISQYWEYSNENTCGTCYFTLLVCRHNGKSQ